MGLNDQWNRLVQKANQMKNSVNDNYQNYQKDKANREMSGADSQLRDVLLNHKRNLLTFAQQNNFNVDDVMAKFRKIDANSTQLAMVKARDFKMNPSGHTGDEFEETQQQRLIREYQDGLTSVLAGCVNAKIKYRYLCLDAHEQPETIETHFKEVDTEINAMLDL